MVQSINISLELDLLSAERAAEYVISSATTILTWDIMIHLPDEVELLFLPRSFRPPTIAYFISRYTMLAYFILQHFAEDLKGQCTAPRAMAISVVGYVAVITTLLQFLIRAKAIFSDVRFAQWFFTCLWLLAACGISLLIAGASSGICNSDYSFYVPVISVLVHDSCVFVAISYRIYIMSMAFPKQSLLATNWNAQNRSKMVETLLGKNLPSLSRALLRNGQMYYLISLMSSIATLSLMLDTSLLPPERLLLAPMHVLIINVTAGHVFREVRLGRMQEHEISSFYQHESQCSTLPRTSQETDEISVMDIC